MATSSFVTGKVRLSYVNLWEPRAQQNDDGSEGPLKYSVVLLIPKSDKATMKKIREAEAKAKEEGKSTKWNGKIPPNVASIIHDGDEEKDTEDYPEYAGHYYMSVTAQAKYPPKIVDHNVQPILDQSEVYSGCYARVSLVAFPYSGKSKGVSFGLRNVQKLGDGEPLGGVSSRPEDEFDAVELSDEEQGLL